MWILDIDPKAIKNPCNGCISFHDCKITGDVGTTCIEETIYKAQQAVLAHAHEIDIDEMLKEWDTTRFLKEYRQQTFSQFLESQIKTDTEEKRCIY